jgi:hypothetical protein
MLDLSPLFSNPVVVGALIATGLKAIQKFLEKLDAEKALAPYDKHLKLIYIVTTFLASTAELAMHGHLSQVNLEAVINFVSVYLPMYVGGKAMGALPVKPAVETEKSVDK